jgi:membrane-associated phospholipid phosphatase
LVWTSNYKYNFESIYIKKGKKMNSKKLKYLIYIVLGILIVIPIQSQTQSSDSTFHPYHVNYWVTGAIIGIGMTTNYLGIPKILHKTDLTSVELQGLNRDVLNSFDRWALRQDPLQRDNYAKYSDYTLTTIVVLPATLLFDKQIRKDWGDLLLMYGEVISITSNIYEWSFLGPTFINRFRPVTYYTQLTNSQRETGNNRNSFYSGHVASASAATFFMAKVLSDYNPQIGDNKYFLYGAAAVPPLILSYLRVKSLQHFPSDCMVGLGVGALCGIVIPELHRVQVKDLKLGLFTNPEATGITMNWQPEFLK